MQYEPVRSPRSFASFYSKSSFYSSKFVYSPICSDSSSDRDPYELAYFVSENINRPYLPNGDNFLDRYDFDTYNNSRQKLLGTRKSKTQEKLIAKNSLKKLKVN